MAVLRGDWWAQDPVAHRPVLKNLGDVDSTDLADGAVTSGKLGANAVTCSRISTGHVVSEHASVGLVTRSIICPLRGTVSSDPDISTGTVLWRPLVPVHVDRAQLLFTEAYVNATDDDLTLFGNAGTSMAGFVLTSATGYDAGTRLPSGVLTQRQLAACTDVLAKLSASTCSNPGQTAIQIDFSTTG